MLNATSDHVRRDAALQSWEPSLSYRRTDRRSPVEHRSREPLNYATCQVLQALEADYPLSTRALEVAAASAVLRECEDIDAVLKTGVELARNLVGLERVGFYLRDPDADTVLLRGTWGTGSHGETTSEHGLFHEISLEQVVQLLRARATDSPCWCRRQALLYANDSGRSEVLGVGWVMVTPLLAFGHLVGVMYNDAALSGTAPDPAKQALGAVLCSMVAAEFAFRFGEVAWKSGVRRARRPTLGQRVQEALSRDLRRTGRDIAREFGVSGAFLAREFKREMGVSLVEYRNRARFERFQRLMQEHPSGLPLKQAARQAGFGSYAQFNRVHRSMFGTSYAARGSRAGVALASGAADSEVTGGPA